MPDPRDALQGGLAPGPVAGADESCAEAIALASAGKLDEAESILSRLLREFPEYVAAVMALGQIQVARNQYGRALSLFTNAATLRPHDWTILTNLGRLYGMMAADELAIRTLDQAAAIAPDEPEIKFVRAIVDSEQLEYRRAIDGLRAVLEATPGHLGAAYHLGRCCSEVGLVREAADALTAATASSEFGISAFFALSRLPPSARDVDMLALADRFENDPATQRDETARTRLRFARATALHERRLHDEAWRIVVDVNAAVAAKQHDLYRQRYEAQKHFLAMASDASDYPDAGSLPAAPDGPVPLFILGPSRSGKSQLERLFDGVPGVKLGYESKLVDNSCRQVCQIAGLPPVPHLARLPSHLDDRFRSFYLDALRSKCAGAGTFTDTNPGNIVNIGRLHALVPSARFVFVSRDALDTGFRIFLKHYKNSASNSYAYDLRWIRDHLDWYAAMAEAWTAQFPEACLNLTYETLVSNPVKGFARVADFCGIRDVPSRAVEVGDDRGCAAPYADRMRPAFGI